MATSGRGPGETQLCVTLGDTRYAVERPWGRVDGAAAALGPLSQVAVDRAGNVYAFQRAETPVTVFGPDGERIREWGHGLVADAHGICIDAHDRVHLVDRDAHQILQFTTEGEALGALGDRHAPRQGAPFNHPTAIAVAPDGEMYVADGYGNTHVHRFSPGGKLIQSWGRPGTGPGEFSTPHGIWVDRRDRVLVADRENDRVQLFSRDGDCIGQWTGFYHPMDLFEDGRGFVYVSDQTPRLSLLSPDGELVGRCRPVANGAHGVWGSAAGDIFLAEMQPNRLTRLRPEPRSSV